MLAIFIHGPTASGKSALALTLAERIGGQIVNADAMQVYGDLRVLTARPDDTDLARAEHHLYGHVDGAQTYSVGQWQAEATRCIADIRRRGQCPIVVGGTGLAFTALQGGLSAIPPVSAAARASYAAISDGNEWETLARCDPVSARRIKATDTHRVRRALEVYYTTAQPLSAFHERSGTPIAAPWLGITLTPPRPWVHERIATRLSTCLSGGAIDEVRALGARTLDPQCPIMRSHGVPWILSWLDERMSRDDMYEKSCADMRRYAKRQSTWAAHQLPCWPRIAAVHTDDRARIICALASEIDGMAGLGRAA